MYHLGKSVGPTRKNALKLLQFPSLKVIRPKRAKIYKQTSPYKRLQKFWTLRSYILVSFQQITFKLRSFTDLKTLFLAQLTDFCFLVHVKS